MARRKKKRNNQFIFIFLLVTEKFDIPDIPWYSI